MFSGDEKLKLPRENVESFEQMGAWDMFGIRAASTIGEMIRRNGFGIGEQS